MATAPSTLAPPKRRHSPDGLDGIKSLKTDMIQAFACSLKSFQDQFKRDVKEKRRADSEEFKYVVKGGNKASIHVSAVVNDIVALKGENKELRGQLATVKQGLKTAMGRLDKLEVVHSMDV
ncbi:hypothetical protein BGX34_003121 [Mortierella sp. NVP85]|nr:hypothetical protein BGX34_003121 [Mortierella sp. NVP85]